MFEKFGYVFVSRFSNSAVYLVLNGSFGNQYEEEWPKMARVKISLQIIRRTVTGCIMR